ncbi:MAG TPA: SRPBCC domain-containing protein [Kofleriaceae bacterium]|nr:SRPBCC domain-containing protein [Kofleriaceae bacterium]
MKNAANPGAASRGKVTVERTFDSPIEDVWELWTTKEGIESWWGPDGFAVVVHAIDLRPGGKLRYAMSAVQPEMVAYMKQQGMPTTNECTLTFTEVVPNQRLAYLHLADFIPGVEPYEVVHVVELQQTPAGVRMTLTFDTMHADEWTERAKQGWENEVNKLGRALATRAKRPA